MKKVRLLTALDCSGSMGRTKRYIAKQNYMQFAKLLSSYDEPLPKYFVQFTTSALYQGCNYTNNPEPFFNESLSGGTYISTGLLPILEEVKNTPEDIHNVVIVYSDGDNWGEDNDTVINTIIELSKTNTTFVFTRISLSTYMSTVESHIIEHANEYEKLVWIQRLYHIGDTDKGIDEELKEKLLKSIEGEQ